jgi:hypothetical protein
MDSNKGTVRILTREPCGFQQGDRLDPNKGTVPSKGSVWIPAREPFISQDKPLIGTAKGLIGTGKGLALCGGGWSRVDGGGGLSPWLRRLSLVRRDSPKWPTRGRFSTRPRVFAA